MFPFNANQAIHIRYQKHYHKILVVYKLAVSSTLKALLSKNRFYFLFVIF